MESLSCAETLNGRRPSDEILETRMDVPESREDIHAPYEDYPTEDPDAHENDEPTIDDDVIRCPRPNHRRVYSRKRAQVDPERLLRVRKRLFHHSSELPTEDVFYMEGERIDMTDPLSCELQRVLFARILNSMLNFSQTKIDVKDTQLRQALVFQARATETRLKRLQNNAYRDYHLDIASNVRFILQALEETNYLREDELIMQLVPITCTIDNGVRKRLRVNDLELRQVKGSRSLSVVLNVDMKFIYAGTIRSKTTDDAGERFYAVPARCMGAYMYDVISDLYDLVYDRTKEYVERFFARYPDDPAVGPVEAGVFNSTDASGVFNKGSQKDQNDRAVLDYLLRSIGRDANLRKMDVSRTDVFALTSPLKKKTRYLNSRSNKECNIECQPIEGTDAVFLSSFVRARIMENGSLYFQIYSRTCMYMSDEEGFPRTSTTTLV